MIGGKGARRVVERGRKGGRKEADLLANEGGKGMAAGGKGGREGEAILEVVARGKEATLGPVVAGIS